jgi:hypothetical protein
MTSPAAFARSIAQVLLAYGPDVDFEARRDVVMAVAALPPLGSPDELSSDLFAFTPNPVGDGGAVTFAPDSVALSLSATARITRLGLPAGSFAIDVAGSQTITMPGQRPVLVSVTMGITGACPPALTQCEIDRIFPRTIRQELEQ